MEEVVGSIPTRSTKSLKTEHRVALYNRHVSIEHFHPAYYSAQVSVFLGEDVNQILGKLAAANAHDLELQQRRAWEEEIEILKKALLGMDGTIFLELRYHGLGVAWMPY